MQQRKLGSHGPVVSALGLGCMGMSDFYSTGADRREAIATLHRALELGVTLLDTADMYGPHTNEELVGKRSRASGNRCSWPPSSASCAIRRILRRAASAAGPSISGAPSRQPAALGRGGDRSLLSAPGRSAGADRGRRRHDGGSDPRRQDPPYRPERGVGRHAGAGAQGTSDHRAADRVFAVDARCRAGRAGGL